jgi:hypothetical protein
MMRSLEPVELKPSFLLTIFQTCIFSSRLITLHLFLRQEHRVDYGVDEWPFLITVANHLHIDAEFVITVSCALRPWTSYADEPIRDVLPGQLIVTSKDTDISWPKVLTNCNRS